MLINLFFIIRHLKSREVFVPCLLARIWLRIWVYKQGKVIIILDGDLILAVQHKYKCLHAKDAHHVDKEGVKMQIRAFWTWEHDRSDWWDIEMKYISDPSISMQYYSLIHARNYKNAPAQFPLFICLVCLFAYNDFKTVKIFIIFINFYIWIDGFLILVKKEQWYRSLDFLSKFRKISLNIHHIKNYFWYAL